MTIEDVKMNSELFEIACKVTGVNFRHCAKKGAAAFYEAKVEESLVGLKLVEILQAIKKELDTNEIDGNYTIKEGKRGVYLRVNFYK
jgi:hypothetical protein